MKYNTSIEIPPDRLFKTKIPVFVWDKVFKKGPSKIRGRQPLKNLKGYTWST